jgi:hypothetical protein
MSAIALFIVLLLNAGIVPATAEDSPAVTVMGYVAQGALVEAHPECDPATRWDFNRDNSAGLEVTARGTRCEYAAEFYRNPDTLLWQFAVAGS